MADGRVTTRSGRPLSHRRPLAWRARLPLMAGGLLVGVEAGDTWGVGGTLLLGAVACASPIALLANRRLGTAVALGSWLAVLGAVRVLLRDPECADPVALETRSLVARVEGVRQGVGRGGQGARFELTIVAAPGRTDGPRPGEGLRLSIGRRLEHWEIGDEVALRVAPRRARGFCNGGDDAWADWLERRGLPWTGWLRDDGGLARREASGGPLRGVLARTRGAIGAAIDRAVADPAAAVLRALVIGDKGRLSPELRETFARTGTSHLLAVSGMHLALVAAGTLGLAKLALAWTGRRWLTFLPLSAVAAPIGLLAASAYAGLTGASVATLRALAMVACFVGGQLVGRRASALAALAVAAAALVAADPGVRFDLSFQLSVVSVAAIVLVMERTRDSSLCPWLDPGRAAGRRSRALAWVLRGVVISLAVTVATAPLAASYFGRISLVGALANLLVAPTLGPGALALGLLGSAAALVAQPVGAALLAVAGATVDVGIAIARGLAKWRLAAVAVGRPAGMTALSALTALGALGVGPGRRAVAVALGAASVCALWAGGGDRPAGVRLSILDVGQGDASILESPGGDAWVVDGGGLGGDFDTGAGVVVPALARRRPRRLVAVVLSHADRDHYGGLRSVIEEYEPRELWWNGRASHALGFRRLLDAATAHGVRPRRLASGSEVWHGRDGLEIHVLHPGRSRESYSANDASLVLVARFGATRILFTGDVEARGERALVASGQDVSSTIVKVPHHGSRTSSTGGFVRASRPALAVASLGIFNRFGFPAPEVVARYRGYGSRWRATGRLGEVVVESDGQLERVAVCRG